MHERAEGEQVNARWAMVALKRKCLRSTLAGVAVLQLGSECFFLRFGGLRPEGPLSRWFPLMTPRRGQAELEVLGQLKRQGNLRTARALVKSLGMLA